VLPSVDIDLGLGIPVSDMKIRNVLMAIFLLSLANTVILPILAQDEATGVTSKSLKAPSNETELADFVEFAASHARDVGKYEAIKDFMDLNGSWVRGDIYIFAHEFNGTSLCLPYMPKEVGTDRSNIQNDQGIYINRDMRSIALNGSGFYEYNWQNPLTNQSEPKISYVMKVDDTWYLGAGIYKAELDSDKNSVNATIGTDNDMAYFLLQLQASIQGQLNDLDSAVADSSYQLSAIGIEGEKARDILRNLTGSSPYFTEATTGSPEGKIAAAEPAVYRNLEGADISKNDATIRLMQTKSPVFSPVFHLVEGYDASIVSYPVFSATGEFIGGVGAIIKPAELLGSIIAPRLLGTNYSVTVMQKDGLSLYDSDPSQVGKNLFSDPIYQPYPQLLALGKNVVAERSGMGRYVFQNNEHNGNITKEVYWTSVGLHGNEWRLVAIRASR
jgi:polar amino acid transport system substrate-binding protein